MSDVVIKVENISKQYRLGEVGTGTLSHDLNRWWHKVRGKEDPYLRIGESNDRTKAANGAEYVWSLKDVSFEVKRGEVLGIIGRNGAGKSTLLKILSRVTSPTSGQIKVKGRIASLLEVGTGFNPELTGRDNIYLNGAILGMRKREIDQKFDEIVAFAEVERYIDTPVKRYSSGMYVRLAFAVAAHLEPEILIVDEVLAVGDAEFQKKCLGKMQDVAGDGRTILFVSHNLSAVASLCTRALLLVNGQKLMDGQLATTLSRYLEQGKNKAAEIEWKPSNREANNGRIRLAKARIISNDLITIDVAIDQPTIIQYEFEVIEDGLKVSSAIHIFEKQGTCVLTTLSPSKVLNRGLHEHSWTLPANFLNNTHYSVSIILLTNVVHWEVLVGDAISFSVHEQKPRSEFMGNILGCVRPILECKYRMIMDKGDAVLNGGN